MQEELAIEGSILSTSTDRHRVAIDNSLTRAAAAAEEGRFDDALAWLEVVRTVDGGLSEAWETRRRSWQAARDGLWQSGMEAG